MIWWTQREQPASGLTAREIATLMEGAGYPGQNVSRLEEQLAADRRTARVPGSKSWRLNPASRVELDGVLTPFVDEPKPIKATDSVVPRSIFKDTRGYIEQVVHQINASYDAALYDCCAVMCRRLLETLIIETYEHRGRARDIQAADGNFFMLAELQRRLLADSTVNLSRNGKKGLEDFKRLGDWSAHNRRFNATRADIDRVRDGLRLACQELLHLAGLA